MLPFLQNNKNKNFQTVADTSNKYNWEQKIEDIKSGKLDPKEAALDLISKLSPKQKIFLKMSLPMFQKLANKSGATDETINNFLTEIKAKL